MQSYNERILCSDESCIGTLNESGHCNICGKAANGLNDEYSIWIEQEELGNDKVIEIKKKSFRVKIPKKIEKKVTLRLKGLGKTKGNRTGDILLHVRINQGENIRKNLWVSETSAKNGDNKILLFEEKKIRISLPKNSYDGLVVRLRGLGRKPSFDEYSPSLNRKNGDLLVNLCVYPDNITQKYGPLEILSTVDFDSECWVYLKIDEIIHKMGSFSFPISSIKAEGIADIFNEYGWRGIFHVLVDYLHLTHLNIQLNKSNYTDVPGCCQIKTTFRNGVPVNFDYMISINELFLDNPFSVAAIASHELCHVIYSEKIEDKLYSAQGNIKTGQASLEEERTVDILVFMYKLGEFQLRISRDILTFIWIFQSSTIREASDNRFKKVEFK